jgi:DNA-binding GntR family transcriptional regulator
VSDGFLPDISADRTTTVRRVQDALRSAVLSGDLAPGTPLREVELASTMNVSRGTIREAVLKLSNEGLVRRSSFKGMTVTKLSADEIRDLFVARKLIELSAVDAVARRAAEERMPLVEASRRFTEALAGIDPVTQNHTDLDVHRTLVSYLGSARLSQIHDGLMNELQLALSAEYREADPLPAEELADRHAEFLELLQAGDGEGAREQLRSRLERAEALLIRRSLE